MFSKSFVVYSLLSVISLTWSKVINTYPPVNRSRDDVRSPLYFGLIVSFREELNTSSNIVGVQLALDKVNSDPFLLQNYSLHYVLSDSNCDRNTALSALFEQLESQSNMLALIGAGCSVSTELTAEVSHYFKLSQLSCSSDSTVLANRERFPKYFQLIPTISQIAFAYSGLLKVFDRHHVTFIIQDKDYFSKQAELSIKFLNQQNISSTMYLLQGSDDNERPSIQPTPFMNASEKIFIFVTDERYAIELLCEAHKQDIRYPTHILITYQWYSSGWWLNTEYNGSCSNLEREEVLYRSLALTHFETKGNDGNESIFGGQTFTPYCFDATMALAYAINRTIVHYARNTSADTDNFDESCLKFLLKEYKNQSVLDLIFDELSDTSFHGITGNVTFDENGIREINSMPVYQFRYCNGSDQLRLCVIQFGDLIRNDVGNNYTFKLVYDVNETFETVWPDGIPPDGIIIDTFLKPVTIIFCTITSIGIIFAFICLIFNLLYQKRKVVRLTSPKLNYFIIGGAWLFYVDIYFFVIPTVGASGVRFSCNITTWLTVIAYTLCFGTIMAKMCRVWLIFRRPRPNRRMVIKDWVLATVVLTLLALDLVILAIYTALEQTLGGEVAKLIPNTEVFGEQENAASNHYVYICSSKIQEIVVGFLYAFKLLLQVVSLGLAFLTRKVKVKGLDDAKYIAVIIYVTSIVIAIIAVCEFSLSGYPNAYAVIFSTGILLAPTFILALLFIPTMIRLYKDPKGEKVFNATMPRTTGTSVGELHTIDTLKSRVKELENMLSALGSVDENKVNIANNWKPDGGADN